MRLDFKVDHSEQRIKEEANEAVDGFVAVRTSGSERSSDGTVLALVRFLLKMAKARARFEQTQRCLTGRSASRWKCRSFLVRPIGK
jgi:hypothetical protein